MKKLLVLMLVFVMASVASAGLTTGWYYSWSWTDDNGEDVEVGDTISVEIFAGDSVIASPILDTVLNVDDAASATNFALTTTGDWSYKDPTNGISSDGSGGYNVLVSGNLNAGKVPKDASIYSFQFVTDAVGTVTIDAVSGNWSTFTAAVGQAGEALFDTYGTVGGLPYANDIVVVPEPMTIALLGLGGLFLLRRRK